LHISDLEVFYGAAWFWGLPLITANILNPEYEFDKSQQTSVPDYHKDTAFEATELTI